MALVFRQVWPTALVLNGPDGMPDFSNPGFLRRLAEWMNRGDAAMTLDGLLRILLPQLTWHEPGLCITFALQAVAMAAFLRQWRLPVAACCFGGVSFALSGYNFTLFAAGHRGLFTMTLHAALCFAFAEGAIRRPGPVPFALCALSFWAGLAMQPDVMALYMLLLSAYALFRLVHAPLASPGGPGDWWRRRRCGLALGLVAGTAVFAAAGAPTFRTLLSTALAGREKQLSDFSAPTTPADTAAEAPADSAAEAAKRKVRWIFATNWSLPPAEALEFVAPGLHGLDSANPSGPYWGALGRTDKWEEAGAGFVNYRQHSLYMGAVGCALALFALVSAIFTPRCRHRAPLAFFAVAALVAVALAFGRNTPLYRVFYAIPPFDKVRAPVKFVHLAEFCVAAMAAFGLARLLAPERDRGEKAGICALFVAAVALFFVAPALSAGLSDRVLAAIGVTPGSDLARTLASMHDSAPRHGALLFLLVGAAAAVVRAFPRLAMRRTAAALLAMVAVADLACDAAHYVTAIDASARLAPSPAADALLKGGIPGSGQTWSYLELTRRQPLPENSLTPFLALDWHGIERGDPALSDSSEDHRIAAWRALAFHPARFWALLGVTGVFMPPAEARVFVKNGQGSVLGLYDVDRRTGRLIVAANLRSAGLALVSPTTTPPYAAVYHDWNAIPDGGVPAAAAEFAKSSFDPLKTLVVCGDGANALADVLGDPTGAAPEPASILAAPGKRGSAPRVTLETDSSASGLLFVRDRILGRFWPRLGATVDGAPVATVFRANGSFLAVPVPAGRHSVEISPALPARLIALPLLAAAAFLALCAVWVRDNLKEKEESQ